MSCESGDRQLAMRRTVARLLRTRSPEHAATPGYAHWDPDYLGLSKVARFRDASAETQQTILADISNALLMESWGIERTGVAFCARMTMLAESFDEQRLFSLIGADEAAHSAWLEPWIPEQARNLDPFGRFIAGLAESGSPNALAYLMQVVLEGFGIVHYAGLAGSCRDPVLATLLKRMAQDEALHHAAGIAAFDSARLSNAERSFLAEGACAFLHMIRSGPQAAAGALDRATGIADRADAENLFTEFDSTATTFDKLSRLRALMNQPGMAWLVDELEQKNLFSPCTPAECARIYTGAR